ncbi:MAG TPA: ArsR family transcriptional regulator [Gemmatimonadaceae bacterium]|nr:ArsR family transcriptional regulator [Gemmatimonadaceae bacterium]
MAAMAWNKRFFESTRGRIVALLRRADQTVDDLARELGLTDNAVRTHLATLERDGIVRQDGVRRGGGVGKPATIYELAPEAEPGFSSAYVPLLRTVLDTLADQLTPAELQQLMREVGRRLAAEQPDSSGSRSLRARVELASQLLNDLGGATSVEEERGALRIQGFGCPLSAVVSSRPEVCQAVQTMLTEMVGSEVRECCSHGDRPSCCFAVPTRRSA